MQARANIGDPKPWEAIFTKKKAPAARYIAATELVKVWIMAASWVSTTIR